MKEILKVSNKLISQMTKVIDKSPMSQNMFGSILVTAVKKNPSPEWVAYALLVAMSSKHPDEKLLLNKLCESLVLIRTRDGMSVFVTKV